ncbi:MAG: hypothetical protein B7X93_11195 [Hydrogenophilales bacterium 17-61-9]|nr:MAG: hypothetical protein B7X93_11195 [Hydrogenophilales bacterium 17-61-9]
MRLKIHNAIGVFAWSLAILAGSLPGTSVASMRHVTATDSYPDRQPAMRPASYSPPGYAYASFAVNDAPVSAKSSVSGVPEVDGRTMFAAILGLVGMRLWRGGEKTLPIIK